MYFVRFTQMIHNLNKVPSVSKSYKMVFCYIVVWIQPDNFRCQQDYVLSKNEQLKIVCGISEMFEIVKKNTEKCLRTFHFEASENQAKTDFYSKKGHYVFLGYFLPK